MKIPVEILLITCSTGAIQSGFFSVYLFLSKKRTTLSHKMLACLLLALTLRMTKSVGYYFSYNNLPASVENVGYAAHIAIAPLLLLYIKSFLHPDSGFEKKYWIHLVPALCILLLSPFLDRNFWLSEFHGYRVSLFYMGIYLVFSFYLLWKKFYSKKNLRSRQEWAWLFILTGGIAFIWAAYAANFLLGWVAYMTAPVIFSFLIYSISYFALKQHSVLFKETKGTEARYKNSSLSQQQLQFWGNQIQGVMEKEKPWRDPQFNLTRLSRLISTSPHITSEVINRHFQKNFPDFITGFRLTDASEMLRNVLLQQEKIASIAFEAGFSTVSSFNTVFKKQLQLTPSEYRKKFCKPETGEPGLQD